jgi:hypothetical protein
MGICFWVMLLLNTYLLVKIIYLSIQNILNLIL